MKVKTKSAKPPKKRAKKYEKKVKLYATFNQAMTMLLAEPKK